MRANLRAPLGVDLEVRGGATCTVGRAGWALLVLGGAAWSVGGAGRISRWVESRAGPGRVAPLRAAGL